MNPRQTWLPLEAISQMIQLEQFVVILSLALGAWGFFKLFLRDATQARKKSINGHYRNLAKHILFFSVLYTVFVLARANFGQLGPGFVRASSYIGLGAIIAGCAVLIKTFRILILQYLFFSHKAVGVPLLLVNIFTLIVSISLGLWLVSELFNVRLTPLLATSAAVSLVLGLALQDTLGNLFAGMAMQFDKPYEIGDWIEVHQGAQKWMGQVHEITWRAVTLTGFADEVINIPNRIVAASQILNFAAHNRPFWRGTNFRVPYGVSLDQALTALAASAHGLPGVAQNPRPSAFVNELGESWVSLRLVYAISDYGNQNYTADGVIRAGLAALERMGVNIAPQRLLLLNQNAEKVAG